MSVFAPGGPLARALSVYEHRLGQGAMAREVSRALQENRHLVVEAGTGTGKTLAYLVPAIESGLKVVISTGTRALQDQIAERELPLAARALGRPASFAVLKGRENYLCRRRFLEFEREPLFEELPEARLWPALRSWAASTRAGDRAELPDLPDGARVFRRLDARAETCTGSRCGEYERCFLVAAKHRAAESRLVVVNHALFFADLALRQGDFGSVLPEYDRVILDEAHLVEDVAGRHFGRELTSHQLDALLADAGRELRAAGRDAGVLARPAGAAEGLFRMLRGLGDDRRRFAPRRLPPAFGSAVETLLLGLDGLGQALSGPGPRVEERLLVVRRCREHAEALRFLSAAADPDQVYWTEPRGRGVALAAAPVDLAPVLAARLFDAGPGVVLTSATLSVEGRFDFVRRRLGAEGAREALFPSPFDHPRQAVLYLPPEMPDPSDARFLPRVVEELIDLLEITRGRALALFTSHANLRAAAEALRGRTPWPVIVQGEAPHRVLLERLRGEPGTVLLGTNAFREGIDVPGEALSLVLVDRLPFAVPDEPLVAARVAALRRRGEDGFSVYQVPAAVIALRQALGRLLRHSTDRGVLAVTDPRILTRPYGRRFLDSLPDYPRLRDLEEVRQFFRGVRPTPPATEGRA